MRAGRELVFGRARRRSVYRRTNIPAADRRCSERFICPPSVILIAQESSSLGPTSWLWSVVPARYTGHGVQEDLPCVSTAVRIRRAS